MQRVCIYGGKKGKESTLALRRTSAGCYKRKRADYFPCLGNDRCVDSVNCVHAGWNG